MTIAVQKHLFSRTDYHCLAQTPIFREDDHIELIEGEIIDMAPLGSLHASIVTRITDIFYKQCRSQAIIRVQNPIRLGDFSEPEPDIALLRPCTDCYAQSHPSETDVLLLVEVADSSLRYDREVKIPLYARYGIPEVWLVNVANNNIEVFLEPSPQGYQKQFIAQPGQSLVPRSIESVSISVKPILGL